MQFHDLVDRGDIDSLLMFQYRLSYAFEKMGMAWNNRFTDLYKLQLLRETEAYPGACDLLKHLMNKVKLGLITNAYDGVLQRRRIEASGLTRFFHEILIAGEVGVAKPDQNIFLLMCRKFNVPSEECLFIGDSIHYDITGAASAGMKTVLYGADESVSGAPNYRAKDIQELALLVEKILGE